MTIEERWDMKEKLARALHRRHRIDEVAMGFADAKYACRERFIDTSWAAENKTRTYWYLLADEALKVLEGAPLTPLPARPEVPTKCEQCNGTGSVLTCPPGVDPRFAKFNDLLTRETCNCCKGAGVCTANQEPTP